MHVLSYCCSNKIFCFFVSSLPSPSWFAIPINNVKLPNLRGLRLETPTANHLSFHLGLNTAQIRCVEVEV